MKSNRGSARISFERCITSSYADYPKHSALDKKHTVSTCIAALTPTASAALQPSSSTSGPPRSPFLSLRPDHNLRSPPPRAFSRRTMSSPLAHLNGMSEDALQNIVRRLSAAPPRPHWQSWVLYADALSFMQVSGSMASAARSQFTSISFGMRRRFAPHEWFLFDSPWRLPRPAVKSTLHMPSDISILTAWIQAAGVSLTTLIIEQFPGKVDGVDPRYALQENCPSLRQLDISNLKSTPVVAAMLHGLTGRLHKLVAGPSHAPLIAETCTGLRHLSLSKAPPHIGDMLAVIGPTLESLEIAKWHQSNGTGTMLVQAFCPKLSRIVVRDFADGDPSIAYAVLLSSYGAQLRFAYTGSLSKDH